MSDRAASEINRHLLLERQLRRLALDAEATARREAVVGAVAFGRRRVRAGRPRPGDARAGARDVERRGGPGAAGHGATQHAARGGRGRRRRVRADRSPPQRQPGRRPMPRHRRDQRVGSRARARGADHLRAVRRRRAANCSTTRPSPPCGARACGAARRRSPGLGPARRPASCWSPTAARTARSTTARRSCATRPS